MIRRYYALPQDELGCNSVELLHAHITPAGASIEVQPGVAVITPGQDVEVAPGVTVRVGYTVEEGTYEPNLMLRPSVQVVEDSARFLAWYDAQAHDPADHPAQQLVVGLLRYLWLQRAGLLPDLVE